MVRFKRQLGPTKTKEEGQPKKVFFKRNLPSKSVRNADIEEVEEGEILEESGNEDEEDEDFEEVDLCLAGSEKGVCFNCQEVGHFSRECTKPRKKPIGHKQTRLSRFKKASKEDPNKLAKTIRQMTQEDRNSLLDELEEGF